MLRLKLDQNVIRASLRHTLKSDQARIRRSGRSHRLIISRHTFRRSPPYTVRLADVFTDAEMLIGDGALDAID